MIGFVQENQTKDRNDWATFFDANLSSISELEDRGILRKVSGNSQAGVSLVIRFVGLILVGNRAWYCYPSIFKRKKNGDEILSLATTMALLEVYFGNVKKRKNTSSTINEPDFWEEAKKEASYISLFLWLLDWTVAHGFHRDPFTKFCTDGGYGINWGLTELHSLPVPTNRSLIFDPPFWQEFHSDLSLLAVIQAKVLVELQRAIQPLSDALIAGANELMEFARELDNSVHLNVNETIDYLKERQGATFRDHELDLISGLISFYDNQLTSSSGDIRLYGTNGFWAVWEDICRTVLAAEESPELANPRYNLGSAFSEVNPLRPDLFYRHSGCAYILDAKYYPDFPGSAPGVQDITKQMMYCLTYRGSDFTTAGFLLPGFAKTGLELLGEIEMADNGKAVETFPIIHVFNLDWDYSVSAYIKSVEIPELRELIAGLVKK